MTDPSEIGIALFDPSQVDAAVASLVDQMGIAIYSNDGSLLQAGTDTGAGPLWLTEGELHGLVEMTEQDIEPPAVGQGPLMLSDLYDALAPYLPGYSAAQFAATYDDAYGAAPDSFVARVMGNIPLDPSTPLMRIQAWLLLIDGFVGPPRERASAPLQRRAAIGVVPADEVTHEPASTAQLGTARAHFDQLAVDEDLAELDSAAEAELMSHLITLPRTVNFVVEQSGSAHEGHGGPGDTVVFTARLIQQPLISRTTGKLLLPAGDGSVDPTITWRSDDPATLQDHGSLSLALNSSALIGNGTAITYSLKAEDANGRGVLAEAPGSLYAEADALDLVRAAYMLPESVENATRKLVSGTRRGQNGTFLITWHALNSISITLHNEYDVMLQMLGGELLGLHRFGADDAVGALTRQRDGTYRGVMQAETYGHADGSFSTGLVTAECHDASSGTQRILVVGRPVSTAASPPPSPINAGALGSRDMILSVYPASPPVGTFTQCQPTMPSFKPSGSIAGYYLPFNDSRWNSPDIGIRIHLPDSGTLDYVDDSFTSEDAGISSLWGITVTVPDSPP